MIWQDILMKNSKIESASSFEELKRILAEEEIRFSSEATYTKDGKDISPQGAAEGKLWKPEYIDRIENEATQKFEQLENEAARNISIINSQLMLNIQKHKSQSI